jgi:hypothetical protein
LSVIVNLSHPFNTKYVPANDGHNGITLPFLLPIDST